MTRPVLRRSFAIVLVLAVFAAPAHAVIIANTADDVCLPTDDPCQVTEEVQIQESANLDFGVRELLVTGGGELNFSFHSATISAGNITISPASGPGIKLKGLLFGESVGGSAAVNARRACSGDTALPCLTDTTCSNMGAGTCSAGPAGTLTLAGKVTGGAVLPGFVGLQSAGLLTVSSPVIMDGTTVDSDGGIVELTSTQDSVRLDGSLSATAGNQSIGGDVTLMGALDVLVNQPIDVSTAGGDSEGGSIEIDSTRDVVLDADLLAAGGADFGGSVLIDAGRDFLMTGGSSTGNHRITLNGGINAFGDAGDAGDLDLSAGNDIIIGSFAKIDATGAAPDGDASFDMCIDAGRDIDFSGRINANATGVDGGGGDLEITAAGAITVRAGSFIDMSGGSSGAGILDIASTGPMIFDGTVDGTAGNGGDGAFVSLDASAEGRVGGVIDVSGSPFAMSNGETTVTACQVVIESGAALSADGGLGSNVLVGRERVTVESGAGISATGGTAGAGTNTVRYRDANKPPTISGTINPSPMLVVQPGLVGCPVCPDGEVEQGETCDDGNSIDGDGCSSTCQDEGCVADTPAPGYPTVGVCDDSMGCTMDTCNTTTHLCEHPFSCDDGIDCTTDQCVSGQCQNTANDSFCDDSNLCTSDICTTVFGCQHANVPGPCDDGQSCTINDQCLLGVCQGTPQGCMICGDGIPDSGEACDHGANNGVAGDSCASDCSFVSCGDPDNSGAVRASDALFILQVAVGSASCDSCVCNVLPSGGAAVTASDALTALQFGVGVPVTLNCPPCS